MPRILKEAPITVDDFTQILSTRRAIKAKKADADSIVRESELVVQYAHLQSSILDL